MKRHFQVIFEALLSVFIIVDLLLMSLMIAGFTVGIMPSTVYSISNYDVVVVILI